MHILIVGLNFAPEPTGVGKYTGEMADWLARRGHTVSVVTAPPYYPFWKIDDGYRAWLWHRERVGSSHVIRCPIYVPNQPSGLKRVLHLGSFGLSSMPAALLSALGTKPDIVAAIVPTITSATTALMIARITGARSWVHVQDLEVDAAFDLGILKRGRAERLIFAAERKMLSRFDLVTTISEAMSNRLATKGIAPEKLEIFPNWVDINLTNQIAAPSSLRKLFGIPDDRIIVLYSGSMGAKHGIEIIVEAAQKLLDSRLHFVIAGNGPGRTEIDRLAGGIPNITLLPLQPIERLSEFLAMADIHVLPQRADVADLVMPSKLSGMLASGRPVVAVVTAKSQVARSLKSCGVVTPPGDVAALVDALEKLAQQPEERVRLGKLAKDAAMSLAKDKVLEAMEVRLVRLQSGPHHNASAKVRS